MFGWFGERKPKQIQHPLFGTIFCNKISPAAKAFWDGSGVFPPTGAEITYFIEAGDDGPSASHEQFWQRLCAAYTTLEPQLRPRLDAAYAAWVGDEDPEKMTTTFKLSSIVIPREDSPTSEWHLCFDCGDDSGHQFTVLMRGWEPEGEIQIDG